MVREGCTKMGGSSRTWTGEGLTHCCRLRGRGKGHEQSSAGTSRHRKRHDSPGVSKENTVRGAQRDSAQTWDLQNYEVIFV